MRQGLTYWIILNNTFRQYEHSVCLGYVQLLSQGVRDARRLRGRAAAADVAHGVEHAVVEAVEVDNETPACGRVECWRDPCGSGRARLVRKRAVGEVEGDGLRDGRGALVARGKREAADKY
jgi:hypothetical protein